MEVIKVLVSTFLAPYYKKESTLLFLLSHQCLVDLSILHFRHQFSRYPYFCHLADYLWTAPCGKGSSSMCNQWRLWSACDLHNVVRAVTLGAMNSQGPIDPHTEIHISDQTVQICPWQTSKTWSVAQCRWCEFASYTSNMLNFCNSCTSKWH